MRVTALIALLLPLFCSESMFGWLFECIKAFKVHGADVCGIIVFLWMKLQKLQHALCEWDGHGLWLSFQREIGKSGNY